MRVHGIGVFGFFVVLGACSDDAGAGSRGGSAEGGIPIGTTAGATAGNGSPGSQSVGSGGFTVSNTGPSGGGGLKECTSFAVKSDRVAPDMLIVMDASGSMAGANETGANRWIPAVDAVNTVVAELERDVQFGLMTFPAAGEVCTPGQLDVPLDLLNAQPIANALGRTMPLAGLTPTSATLAAAEQVLAQREPSTAGEFPPPQYIMLVTDGDPNCVEVTNAGGALLDGLLDGLLGGGGGMGMPVAPVPADPSAQQQSVEKIADLTGRNILTYVIGYDTAGTTFAPVLDQMAAAGGTGDTQHRSVTNGQELIEEFRSITSGAVSCSFVLAEQVDPRYVVVTVDGEKAEFGVDWQIQPDGRTLDLMAGACDALQVGATINAEVNCEIVNVI